MGFRNLQEKLENYILHLKCGSSIGYGISQKYRPILISGLDLNQNSGFGHTLPYSKMVWGARLGPPPPLGFQTFLQPLDENGDNSLHHIASSTSSSSWSSPFTFHYGNESESSSKIPRNPAEYASQMDRVITKDD